jgi:predicted nucleic acid-binding protein
VILVDTSAWVEYDRASGSPVHLRLRGLIASEEDVAVTEPVVMEVAAGARTSKQEQQLRRLLARFHLLRFDPVIHFDGAVRLYRLCRQAGVTPRGLIDCMIAAVAVSHDADLLSHDSDLSRMAGVTALTLDRHSLRH